MNGLGELSPATQVGDDGTVIHDDVEHAEASPSVQLVEDEIHRALGLASRQDRRVRVDDLARGAALAYLKPLGRMIPTVHHAAVG